MDIELLKTFLEVSRTRHFGKAADNLFLTQSAVSARVKLLEETVGVPLFQRARNNIQLTAAGQKLIRHAEGIVNLWNRARQQALLSDEVGTILSICGVPSLWDIFLQVWFERLYMSSRKLILHVDVQGPEVQLRMLRDGTLDLGFMFEIPQDPGFSTKEVSRVPLIMVSTTPDTTQDEAIRQGYILADWGTSFASSHARYFPDMQPVVRVGLGRIALSLILNAGGAAYLAESMVRDEIHKGALHLVADAPIIERSAFAVYSEQNDRKDTIESVLADIVIPSS